MLTNSLKINFLEMSCWGEEGKLCPGATILYVNAPKKMANSISNLHQNWVLAVKHERFNAGTSPNLANCPRPDKSIPHI